MLVSRLDQLFAELTSPTGRKFDGVIKDVDISPETVFAEIEFSPECCNEISELMSEDVSFKMVFGKSLPSLGVRRMYSCDAIVLEVGNGLVKVKGYGRFDRWQIYEPLPDNEPKARVPQAN